MKKDLQIFYLGLFGFTLVLCALHYYIIHLFLSEKTLFFPIWVIYLFNITLVAIVYSIIRFKDNKGKMNAFSLFLLLTLVKMALAIVFFLPLFTGKTEDTTIEVFNFFIPYFFFLVFEIFSLNKFLKNQ
jgi:hypothetical protein